jgi:small subunit ribosomal protein S4
MIRKHKLFARPKKAYEKTRIKEENALAKKYGLKSKREIWKTIAKVDYFRTRAKELAKSSSEEQQVLFDKLNRIGLNVNSIADVLGLQVENLLQRRLPYVVFQKGMAKSVKEARQMVVHKNVIIDGQAVNIPSYLVSVEDESKMVIVKNNKPKAPKAEGESQ